MKVTYKADTIEVIERTIPNSGRVILELTYDEAAKVKALFGEVIIGGEFDLWGGIG